jgi:hypothetical protein
MSAVDRTDPSAVRPNGPLTALYLGLFATAWFSWADGTAPDGLSGWLRSGAYAALAVAVAGAVGLVGRGRRTGEPRDRAADRRYLLIVLIEFAVAFGGAALLNTTGNGAYTPAFVGLVVGLHFLPLARLLHDPLQVPLGIVTAAVAVAAAVVEAVTDTAAGTVAGTGIGLVLLGYAILRLSTSWTDRRAESAASTG